MNLFKRRIPAVVVGSVMLAVFVTACSGEDDTPSEVDQITDAVNNAMKLESELQNVKNRLIIDCMGDAGFDVHPMDLSEDYGAYLDDGYSLLIGSEPPGTWDIPTLEEAKERGFDVGRFNDPDFDWDAYEEEMEVGSTTEDDPFYEMNQKYREEYDQQRYGEEYYAVMYSDDPDDYPDDDDEWPAEGGCTGDVNAAIAQAAGADVEELSWPEGLENWEAQIELYETEALLNAQDEWASCVEGRGHPFFEFDDGMLEIWAYVNSFYDIESGGMEGGKTYDPPAGAPWEFEEAYEKEVELAVDFAECADDTGLREIMQSEWDNAMETIALENKDDIFAWHDRIEGALAAAQGLLKE